MLPPQSKTEQTTRAMLRSSYFETKVLQLTTNLPPHSRWCLESQMTQHLSNTRDMAGNFAGLIHFRSLCCAQSCIPESALNNLLPQVAEKTGKGLHQRLRVQQEFISSLEDTVTGMKMAQQEQAKVCTVSAGVLQEYASFTQGKAGGSDLACQADFC